MIRRVITTIDTHTAGEPTRIVIGGIPPVHGKTMVEKKEYLEKNLDFIRTALMYEPRGHSGMFGAILTAPADDKADFGIVFMETSGFDVVGMCGHAVLGATGMLVETGMVKPVEPITTVVFDTRAGLVTGYVELKNGSIKSVYFHNVPSFLYESTSISLPKIGEVPVDIAFGGGFFAIVNAVDIGTEVDLKNISELREAAMLIKDTTNRKIEIKHPEKPHLDSIGATRIYDKPTHPEADVKNVVISGERGQVDRSPCGTGTSAHIAMLWAKGQLKLNEMSVHESIIGTLFRAKAISKTKVGGYEAVIPEVSCRPYITGMHTFIIDPDDPVKHGFLVQ